MRRVFRLPFVKARLQREVDDELAFHLEERTARLVAAGWTTDTARAEAMRQFGDIASVRSACMTMDEQRERAMRRRDLLGELKQDVLYTLRTLRLNAGFTTIIVAALAIGIGANTAIFTLVNAVLVRQLPVSHPAQLVAIGDPMRVNGTSRGTPRLDILSYPLYRKLRAQTTVFTDVVASGTSERIDVHIDGGSDVEHPRARYVSGNFFTMLGVRAAAGRMFDSTVDQIRGAMPVVALSYGYWTRRFHDDPGVVGKQIVVNGVRMTIVGVAANGFMGDVVGNTYDLWIPIAMHDVLARERWKIDDWSASWLLLLGRLRAGATLAQASAELRPLIKDNILASGPPDFTASFTSQKNTYFFAPGARGFSRVRTIFEAPLVTLMIGVALLLFIICANVANLLLARAVARGREMAVRLALGADRARLVRQLLTESAVLALASAGTGLLVAWWGSRVLVTAATGASGTSSLNAHIDGPVLAFTLVVSMLAVALFGVVPALRASRVDLASTMRAGAAAVTGSALGRRGRRAPLGGLLISGQVALSAVLLVGAAMLVRSLRNVEGLDVGLDRDHLVVVDLDFTTPHYSRARLGAVAHALRDRVAALPGVAAATYSSNGIFSGGDSQITLEVPGFDVQAAADTVVSEDLAGPGYFHAIGGHVVQGRDFTAADEGHAPRTAIVNDALAAFYFPNESAVGKYLHFSDSIAVQIVGVAADVRDHQLLPTPPRRVYFPYVHTDTLPAQIDQPDALRLEVRTTGDPADVVQQLRRAVAAVDPDLPIDNIAPLRQTMDASIRDQRLVAQLATAFGVLALLLAAIGLYGVMSYAISRRTGELGLRVALGAQRGDVVRMILFGALRLVVVGLVVGVPLALASARLLRAQLHGVGAEDPASMILAVTVLSATAVVAALVPALRASKVEPIIALRAE